MIEIPKIEDLFKAGVHLGHTRSSRSPQMNKYIYGVKNDFCFIDLEKTLIKLNEALVFIENLASQNKVILFLGTKPIAKEIIKNYAEKIGAPYIINRWIPGLLTNFETVSNLIKKFKNFSQERELGEWEKYTKKEKLDLEKDFLKLKNLVSGIENLNQPPDAIYIVDLVTESTAVREANKAGRPIVAIVDTNANPNLVKYPIPASDNGAKSIELITSLVARAFEEGKKKSEKVTKTNKKEA